MLKHIQHSCIIACVCTLLCSCSGLQNTIDTGTEHLAKVLVSPEQEVILGEQIVAEIERDVTLHPNSEIQAYINTLGQKLVKASVKDHNNTVDFKFKVIDAPKTIRTTTFLRFPHYAGLGKA